MSDGTPQPGPEPGATIAAALDSLARAVAERVRPAMAALTQIARDPAFRSALAGDRQPGSQRCHCLCDVVHRGEPCLCQGASAGTVRISDMDVPMCAPCQAARAASKLAEP